MDTAGMVVVADITNPLLSSAESRSARSVFTTLELVEG